MEEIERIKHGGNDAKWSVEESLILIAVDELISNHGLSKITHSKLRSHFSVQQIMDIIAIHGMYVILGCMINTWGLELDKHINAKLPEGVTKELFEKEFPRNLTRILNVSRSNAMLHFRHSILNDFQLMDGILERY